MHDFLDNLANHQYQKMYKDKDKEIEKSLEAYREAAKADAWLFGDYDVYKSYDININYRTCSRYALQTKC